MNKGAFCQARGGLGRPERRRVVLGGGGPVWNKHECSLSSLRHRTSLPTFTAVLEKRETSRRWTWVAKGARVEEEVGCI